MLARPRDAGGDLKDFCTPPGVLSRELQPHQGHFRGAAGHGKAACPVRDTAVTDVFGVLLFPMCSATVKMQQVKML